MVWGAVSYKGFIALVGNEMKIDSEYTCAVLEEALLEQAENLIGGNWTFQFENAWVRVSNYTKTSLDATEVDILEWLAKSSDLNIIENVRGFIVWTPNGNG